MLKLNSAYSILTENVIWNDICLAVKKGRNAFFAKKCELELMLTLSNKYLNYILALMNGYQRGIVDIRFPSTNGPPPKKK